VLNSDTKKPETSEMQNLLSRTEDWILEFAGCSDYVFTVWFLEGCR
jgi:hypothetical protein